MRPIQPVRAGQVGLSTAAAARVVLGTALALHARGRSLPQAIVGARAPGGEERHFPARDLVDRVNGTRAFFHAHRHPGDPAGEWGHFHLFVEDARGYSHLAALALDERGLPLHWFATSAWVTGETWRAAPELEHALSCFTLAARGRFAPVARWLTAMVALFRPQLARMLARRDRAAVRHGARARLAGCSARLGPRIAALEFNEVP